ncbi:hypothetical protein WJX73_007038 [Symbiochloris irregularis]|uniref:Uncharacterized protein n=1 Tax=Symbiochloris irregularis TaxID=706552 RepID=A0AAW1PYC5_9CHLO
MSNTPSLSGTRLNDLSSGSGDSKGGSERTGGKKKVKAGPDQRFHIDTFTVEEIMMLAGFGPVVAGNVVAYRDSGKLKRRENIPEIPLVGSVRGATLEHHLIFPEVGLLEA